MRGVTLAALALLTGCGASLSAFSTSYPDNEASSLGAVEARLGSISAASPVGVAFTEEPATLHAFELESGRVRWSRPLEAEPRGAPRIAGEQVVMHVGPDVVGFALGDGRPSFRIPAGELHLIGAAGEGPLTLVVLSTTGAVGAESVVALVRGSDVTHRASVAGAVGAPAVVNGLGFVPWSRQNLSVIDLAEGREIARLRTLSGVVGHALANPHGLFFGQDGVGRFSAAAADGSPASIAWREPGVAELPGRPPLWQSAYDPPPSPRSASHRVRLAWAPAPAEGQVGMLGDTLHLVFYRAVFGLDADSGAIRYALETPADVVGAAALGDGVLLADAAGVLRALDLEGRIRFEVETGLAPVMVALRPGAFGAPGTPREGTSRAEGLLTVAQSTDARLVPARAFAIQRLATEEAEEVTNHLLLLCDDRRLPEALSRTACEALAVRDVGPEVILGALERRASFLEGTRAPPVGALASAALRLGARAAVPSLVAHLRDPHTAVGDLRAIAEALVGFEDASVVEPLANFLRLHHAEADDEALAAGLGAVARAVIALGGPTGRELVQELARSPFTMRALRPELAAALSAGRGAEGEEAETEETEAED